MRHLTRFLELAPESNAVNVGTASPSINGQLNFFAINDTTPDGIPSFKKVGGYTPTEGYYLLQKDGFFPAPHKELGF